jgi:hypothetical protein
MRNSTVTLSEETCTGSHLCAASLSSSLSSIAEYLFCTLSTITSVINTIPVHTISATKQMLQNFALATTTNSTASALKMIQNGPSENVKMRVKLWTLFQLQQKSTLKIAHSTALQP